MKKAHLIIAITFVFVFAAGCLSDTEIEEVRPTTDIVESEPDINAEEYVPERGSYENPASSTESVVLKALGNTYQVSVSDVIRGDMANAIVYEGNMFNEGPPADYEYLLVKMQVAYISGDGPASITSYDFKMYSGGVECESGWVLLPDRYNEFSYGDVMPGGVKDGWLVYTVPINEEAIIAYNPNVFSSDSAYISLGV